MIVLVVGAVAALLLDGFLTFALGDFPLLFAFCYPLLTLVMIVFASKTCRHRWSYLLFALVFGLAFDFLYTSYVLVHGILFLFTAYLIHTLEHNREKTLVLFLGEVLLSILGYHVFFFLSTWIFSSAFPPFYFLVRTILQSLFLNLVVASILYFLFCRSKREHKRASRFID